MLGLRDRLLEAGTIESGYRALAREGMGGVPPLFLDQRATADKGTLVERDQPPKPHLKRRVLLGVDERLPAAIEIHVDQEQARLEARDVERQHARGLEIERLAFAHQHIPDFQR